MKNIVLIGFMGTGKTCVGRILAQQLGWRFVDLDQQVEQTIGMTIADYFSRFGEAAFRDRESEAVRTVADGTRQVVATGGGVVLRQDNIDRLKSCGLMVCLAAGEKEIVRRTAGDRLRPLLNRPDRLQVIGELLAAREPQYRQADLWLETEGRSEAEVAAEILRLLTEKEWLGGTDSSQSG